MKLPDAIVRDLMTLVLAGEASEETRQFVDDYAREHPEAGAMLERARQLGVPAQAESMANKEMETLKRTKEMLRLKSVVLGLGIFFTLAPLAFVFSNGKIMFLMVRDAPGAAAGLWSVAIASWVAYYVVGRGLKTTGL